VVPHLVGADSIGEARELVGDRFEVVEGNRVNGTASVGTIAAQDPYAGELTEVGSEISLDVIGTRIADVPDVRQKTREEAGRILKKAGFEIEVKTTRSSAEDENLVIEQKPSGNADEPAKVGSAVAITVGQGPGSVAVPGVDGQALSAVGQILMEAGLKLGSQMEVPNDRVPEGHVVEQHPAAGTEVEPGSNVDVVVGSGPQQPPTPIAEDGEQPIASKASASAAPSSTAPASPTPASTAPASPAPAAPVPALAADAERGFEHEDGLENEFERDDSSGPGGSSSGSGSSGSGSSGSGSSGSGSSGHGGPG
jgi:serine/threonine-protein kinase